MRGRATRFPVIVRLSSDLCEVTICLPLQALREHVRQIHLARHAAVAALVDPQAPRDLSQSHPLMPRAVVAGQDPAPAAAVGTRRSQVGEHVPVGWRVFAALWQWPGI